MSRPLFGQLGFHHIPAAGHKDKALEYGKDVWMRYTLPTQSLLYFGRRSDGEPQGGVLLASVLDHLW